MKKALLLILACTISLTIGYWIGYMLPFAEGVNNDARKNIIFTDSVKLYETQENFNSFIDKFISDSSFQLERIKFPLISSTLKNADQVETKLIQISDWKITSLYRNEAYKSQIYDNFQNEMKNTDERVFCWEGVENGIYLEYKFKRINNEWYLVEYNDFST